MLDLTSIDVTPAACSTLLAEHGVVCLPKYLTAEDIAALSREFQTCLQQPTDWSKLLDYSLGGGACIDRERIDPAILPATARIFGDRFMAEIADRYLGQPNLLNHEIYVVKDVPGSQHVAQDLHYDRIPTLKFFFYLKDTTVENGAFHCVPSSHLWVREQQRENRQQNRLPPRDQTREIPPELTAKAIPIEGRAGTLIIFHTDTLHRAGIVRSGERWVVRGHTRRPEHLSTTKAGTTPTTSSPLHASTHFLGRAGAKLRRWLTVL